MANEKQKVKLYDSSFSPYVKSASLREENKDIAPTYFEWCTAPFLSLCDGKLVTDKVFYTDGWIDGYRDTETQKQRNVFWLIEPRGLRPENYKMAKYISDLGYCSTVLTYDKELLDECENARFYPLGGSSIAFSKWGIYPKTKDICLIVSDKNTTDGHKLRHQIAERFSDRIDCYGAGIGKPFESKFDVLKEYRFAIVVESCRQDYYFTEKLIDPISVGTVPIYCGCPSISRYFPKSFTIFSSMSGLKSIMWFGDKGNYTEWYDSFIEEGYIESWQKSAYHYRICEDVIFNYYPSLFGDGNG